MFLLKLEVKLAFRLEKVTGQNRELQHLGQAGGDGCAAQTVIQVAHQQGVQQDIGGGSCYQSRGCQPREAVYSHEVIQHHGDQLGHQHPDDHQKILGHQRVDVGRSTQHTIDPIMEQKTHQCAGQSQGQSGHQALAEDGRCGVGPAFAQIAASPNGTTNGQGERHAE